MSNLRDYNPTQEELQPILDAMYEVNMDFNGENAQLAKAALWVASHLLEVTPEDRTLFDTWEFRESFCAGLAVAPIKLRIIAHALDPDTT
jgi:hypothetical protein